MSALIPGPRSTQPTQSMGRRALLRSAAWTVPAITLASAAPAYANSNPSGTPPNNGGDFEPAPAQPTCRPVYYQLEWASSGWARPQNSRGTQTVNATPGTHEALPWDPVAVTVTSTFNGNMQPLNTGTAQNLAVTDTRVGGTESRGLTLAQRLASNGERSSAATHADRQTISFTFDRDVTELSFTITDIDGYEARAEWSFGNWILYPGVGQYRDRVHLSLPAEGIRGNRVGGEGTQADPWFSDIAPNTGNQGAAGDSTLPLTSARGNVAVEFPAVPMRSFSLTFTNSETRPLSAYGQQAIYLTDFSFTANSCK